MFVKPEQPSWKPYDCVYQGWAIIAFATPEKNTIEQLPDAFPYVVGVFDSKEFAIEIAKTMKYNGKNEDGKNYYFLVQGVGINAVMPIIGLNQFVSKTGKLVEADRSEILI